VGASAHLDIVELGHLSRGTTLSDAQNVLLTRLKEAGVPYIDLAPARLAAVDLCELHLDLGDLVPVDVSALVPSDLGEFVALDLGDLVAVDLGELTPLALGTDYLELP
jgi:hypothetical protein